MIRVGHVDVRSARKMLITHVCLIALNILGVIAGVIMAVYGFREGSMWAAGIYCLLAIASLAGTIQLVYRLRTTIPA